MNNKTYLIISGVIFGLSAIGQLIRLIFQIPVQAGSFNIPVWPATFGFIVSLLLCIWAFRLVSKK